MRSFLSPFSPLFLFFPWLSPFSGLPCLPKSWRLLEIFYSRSKDPFCLPGVLGFRVSPPAFLLQTFSVGSFLNNRRDAFSLLGRVTVFPSTCLVFAPLPLNSASRRRSPAGEREGSSGLVLLKGSRALTLSLFGRFLAFPCMLRSLFLLQELRLLRWYLLRTRERAYHRGSFSFRAVTLTYFKRLAFRDRNSSALNLFLPESEDRYLFPRK